MPEQSSTIIQTSKFLEFKKADGQHFNGKQLYNVFNRKNKSLLATVFYYPPWKKYCFTQSDQGIVFDSICLKEIIIFMEFLNLNALKK
jgi:hypothetical protein